MEGRRGSWSDPRPVPAMARRRVIEPRTGTRADRDCVREYAVAPWPCRWRSSTTTRASARRFGPGSGSATRRVTIFTDHLADDDALVERLAPFDGRRRHARADAVPARPRSSGCRTCGCSSPPACATRRSTSRRRATLGIIVCGTGLPLSATAELTWALILAVTRHICEEDAAIRAGGWQHTIGAELAGRTLGVVGLGGARAARSRGSARAFGMDVDRVEPEPDRRSARPRPARRRSAREELFSRADVVTIHVVLSDRTRGLVGARELRRHEADRLPRQHSRGPIVDEAALLDRAPRRHDRRRGARRLRHGAAARASIRSAARRTRC